MTHANRIQRALMLWALLLSLGAAGMGVAGAAQPAAEDPLKIVPADALFCVRINRLMATLGQVDQFLTGISPVGVSMPVRAQLGQFLGQPEPAGINMDGDVAAFWPLPGGEKPEPNRIGVLIPLSNFQQFLTNPNVSKPNAQGIVTIGPEGKPVVAGVEIDNYLLVTRIADEQALIEAKNWASSSGATPLAQRLGASEIKRAAASPAWAYANIQIADKMFGAQLRQKIKEAQKHLESGAAGQPPIPGPPPAAMQVWTTLLNSFLQEVQFVSLTVHPSASAMRLSPELVAMPDSELGKALSTSGGVQQQPNLTGYMANGAITTGVARFNPALMRAIMLSRVELFTSIMGSSMSQQTVAELKKLAAESAEAFGSDAAWTMLPALQSRPPFAVRYVATVRDKQKLDEVLNQSAKLMSQGAFDKMAEQFGVKLQFKVERKVATYKNVPIDAIHVGFQAVDANSPQGKMIQAIYSQGFNIRLAVANDLLLYALSVDPEKEIRALIDQAQAGSPGQIPSEVQNALQLIPDATKANVFGTYNYVRAIRMVLTVLPVPMPPIELPAHGDIAFTGDVGDRRVLVNVAIPKQQVLEVKEMITQMKQKKMQEQEQQKKQGAGQL